jgi:hypothetical protein
MSKQHDGEKITLIRRDVDLLAGWQVRPIYSSRRGSRRRHARRHRARRHRARRHRARRHRACRHRAHRHRGRRHRGRRRRDGSEKNSHTWPLRWNWLQSHYF